MSTGWIFVGGAEGGSLTERVDHGPGRAVLVADWIPRAFLFPSDQKMGMEHWAEGAELSPRELHQMRIQDNQLFAVSPKSGKLLPGQEECVQLSHR